jgi:transposase-like protein
VAPTTDIFSFFRNLNVFVRNKKRFELKVLAVLLNAFGLSLRKTSSFFGILSEPVSKSSIEEWTKKVEAKLSFDPKPHEYPIIAVDETVVKCGGQPLSVWVAVDVYTRQPTWFGVSFTRTTQNALRFLRRLRKRCLCG